MRKSLDWRQIVSCFFLIIITIAISIGTWGMMRTPLDTLPIVLGLICCAVVGFITVYSILIAWEQFRNREKRRKTHKPLSEQFKEYEDYCDNELGKPLQHERRNQ